MQRRVGRLFANCTLTRSRESRTRSSGATGVQRARSTEEVDTRGRSRRTSKCETRTRATHRPEAEDAPPCHVNAKNSRGTSFSECCRRAAATAERMFVSEVPTIWRACARRPTDQRSPALNRTGQSSKLRLTRRGSTSGAAQSWASVRELHVDSKPRITNSIERRDRRATRSEHRGS